jgi:hypothetical protein
MGIHRGVINKPLYGSPDFFHANSGLQASMSIRSGRGYNRLPMINSFFNKRWILV